MSEEEIIKYFKEKEKELKADINRVEDYVNTGSDEEELEAIQGLLDLYNKEKSLNEVLKSKTIKDICYNIGEFDNRFISKDKIRKEKEEIEEMLFKEKNKNAKIEFSYAIGVLEELLEE